MPSHSAEYFSALDLTADNHVHTSLCNHAGGTMEEYVQAALALGLTALTFLEHLEAGISYFERTWLTDEDFDAYFREGERLRRKYRDRIAIRLGVEVGFNPEAVDELRAALARHPFELVGISYHFFPHAGRHLNLVSRRPENIAALTALGADQVLSGYFSGLREAVLALDGGMLCHLDAALRHLPGGPELTASHQAQIDDLLALLREKQMILELNTSGFALRGEPYPARPILARAMALGIPLAAGSDAHQPEQVGRSFERVAEYLAGA
ncbi:MAG: histidinol-phosphatase HisJ family protein [Desulfobulbaceae bacterium]